MPKVKETWMDGITTEMMEHICDDLCKYPDQLSEMELEDKCAECKMGRFVCDILNQYNKINDFANSQCAKLMNQMHELKERDTAKKPKKYGVTDSKVYSIHWLELMEYRMTYARIVIVIYVQLVCSEEAKKE